MFADMACDPDRLLRIDDSNQHEKSLLSCESSRLLSVDVLQIVETIDVPPNSKRKQKVLVISNNYSICGNWVWDE